MLVAATSLLPLGYVVVSSAQLGPGEAADFLVRPRVGELLWNTTRLLVGGVLVSVVLGVGCAWLVVRTDLPSPHLWHGVLAAPLAVPAFVNGYGWVSTTHAVQGYAGAVLVVSLSYYPLVYLPTVAALRRLDSGLEDVAAALGHRPVTTFARVVLPAISPAVLGGALLVGLHLLGEYGALQILNYPTLTTGILALYRTTFNGPAATLLALLLVAFCLLLLGLELLVRGRRRHARVGAGVSRNAVVTHLGKGRLRSSRRPGRAGCRSPWASRFSVSPGGWCEARRPRSRPATSRPRPSPPSVSRSPAACSPRLPRCRSPGSRSATAGFSPR